MRRDLDRIIHARGLDGVVVFAYHRYSPAMDYVTGQRISTGVYARARDGGELLVYDEAEENLTPAAYLLEVPIAAS